MKEVTTEVLRDCLTQSLFSFVSEYLITNVVDETKSIIFLEAIEKELVHQCNNKIFTAFNTNVVVANSMRVLEDVDRRTFYFYLFSNLNFQLRFNYDIQSVYKEVFEKLFRSFLNAPIVAPNKATYYGFNAMKEIPGYQDLASKLEVKLEILEFLEINQWYFIHVLLTLFAQQLLEDFQVFKSSKK